MTIEQVSKRWVEFCFTNNNSAASYSRINAENLQTGIQFHPIPMRGKTRIPTGFDTCTFSQLSDLNKCVTVTTVEFTDSFRTPVLFFKNWYYASDKMLFRAFLKDDPYIVGKGLIIDPEYGNEILISSTLDIVQDKTTHNRVAHPFLRWENPIMHINPIVLRRPKYKWLWMSLYKYVFPSNPTLTYNRRTMNHARREDYNKEIPISFQFGEPECIHILEPPALDDITFDEKVSNLCMQGLNEIRLI